MKFLFFLVVVIFGVAASEDETNHNGPQHKALCDLMKAAVGKWGDGGKGLSEPMSKALNRTIFGKEGGGDITELRKQLPNFYDEVLEGNANRFMSCVGRQSGQSAPYDMVCLCTAGEKGWPLSESGIGALCGQPKDTLGSGNEGWSDEERKKGEKGLNATWRNVVTPCLEGGIGKDLKEALETFKGKLVNKSDEFLPDMYQLGEGKPDHNGACTGSKKYGVCVMYYNGTKTMDHRPWWVDLQNAIPQEEKFQEKKKKREEERRKQQEREKQDIPQAAALTSAPPTNNQTDQQHNKANLTTQFHRLNMTSGTLISIPTTWLLTTIILI
ncbi:Variant surface glycoprotein [Trypanosoma congolense IL3000]|uniref:Variant surface glycoprotein n=1 Tax=Trypanosoma congolense (strain IL3000) TaxID=1068625 RepID=F9WD83_TRYCI|nr:Variant surface glycoprotein [Trypanosoma congolense IL3000]